MSKQIIAGSVEWLLAYRAGAFTNRPRVIDIPARTVPSRKDRPMVRGDGQYCSYCKRECVAYSSTHPTRDHVVPKSKGGKKTVWCCTKCNNAKGDMMPDEWEWFMQNFPRWWMTADAEALGRKAVTYRRKAATSVPTEYEDPEMQAAFDRIYRGRESMLSE